MKQIRILFVYGDRLLRGGMEQFMMNVFRYIDRERFQIDFLLQGSEEGAYDNEILNAGARIFRLPKPGQHPIRYRRELAAILMREKYDIVHAHCDAMNYRVLQVAKACGINVRISHSHNTAHVSSSSFKHVFYEYCRKHIVNYATTCWTCSAAAGQWLYDQHPFQIIPNAIVLERFAFQEKKRAELRAQYGISDDEIVLGSVGRFHAQKNHKFMLDLIEKLVHRQEMNDRKYRLLIVGSGGLLEECHQIARQKGIQDKVIFIGSTETPEFYYNMMDLYIQPSLFEGYPLVVTEAQANGLFCVVSDRITSEVAAGNSVRFCSLRLEDWVQAIEEMSGFDRTDVKEALIQKGMDIHSMIRWLEGEYSRLYEEAADDERK